MPGGSFESPSGSGSTGSGGLTGGGYGGGPTGGTGTPGRGGTPWDPEMGDPTLSPADHGPGFERDLNPDGTAGHRGNPVDPSYGQPRPAGDSGQLTGWQVPPAFDDMPSEVQQLVRDGDAPYGRDQADRPYTKQEFEERYTYADGSYRYPGNDGAVPGSRIDFDSVAEFKAQYSDVLDRMGRQTGDFMSLPGTPFDHRGLPGSNLEGGKGSPYLTMRIVGDLPPGMKIEVSEVAPAFGREGGGLQFRVVEFDDQGNFVGAVPVDLLRQDGFLKIVADTSDASLPPMSTDPGVFRSDQWDPPDLYDDGARRDGGGEGSGPDGEVADNGSTNDRDPGPDPDLDAASGADEPYNGPMSEEGGRRRPRNLFDMDEQDGWAREVYDEVVADAQLPETVAANLADVQRTSGAVGFTPEEIAQVRDHVMVQRHPIADPETGEVVVRQFDPSAPGAAVWERLRKGTFTDSDIVMLEHELAEAHYMRDHPDADYREAHRAANQVADWESLLDERS